VQTKNIQWHGLSFDYPVNSNAGADLTKVGFVERDKVGASYFVAMRTCRTKRKDHTRVTAKDSKKLPDIVAAANTNDIIS
jgi:hypothetical protein